MSKNVSFAKRTILYFKPFWKYWIIVIGLMLLGQIVGAISPLLFGKSVDAVSAQNSALTIKYLSIAFVLSYFQQQIISHIRENFIVKYLDDHITLHFSMLSLNKMFKFSVGQHINEHSGVKLNVVNKGQNALVNLMNNFIYNIFPSSIQILATLVILTFFDWRIALTASIFIGLYVWFSLQRNKKYFPGIGEMRKKSQALSKLQSELFRNSTLVIAEAKEQDTANMFNKKGDENNNFIINLWTKYLRTFYTHRNFLTLGHWVSLGLGVYFIFLGFHSVGMFVTLFAWLGTIFSNIVMIMNTQRQILFQVVEINKYYELLDIEPDVNPNHSGRIIENFSGEIEFKNVSFAYPYRRSAKEDEDDLEIENSLKDENHAILGVSLKIPAGAKVGFVGISGSGKSTIVNLMRRYYDPSSGEIFIDKVPLKEINLEWFRGKIGNVEQKIELFDRSIKENIIFGLPDNVEVKESDIIKAVKDASLDDFVEKLKDNGLETVIGEGGIKVSGGERQRIGIARALIKNPKILIFDEATSALDSINEKLIHDAINRGSKGRTTIIIAHRLSTVMDADIIFVVAKGKIVDHRTHAELTEKSAEYKRLIQNQILAS